MENQEKKEIDKVAGYLVDVKCQRCKKPLTDEEIVRVGRDKTLRLCDKDLLEINELQKKWAPRFLKMKLL